jgi:hypothetical protein
METCGKIPILSLVLTLFLLIFPAGCATSNFDELSKTAKGSIAGATAGAIAGGAATGDVRGVIAGAVIGGFIGNRIGAYMDEQDREKLKQLQLQSLNSGKPQSFVTRKTGDKVTIESDAARREVVESFEVAGGVAEYDLIPADEVSVNAYVNTPVYAETNVQKKPRYVLKQGNGLYVPMHVAGKKGWGAVVEKGMIGANRIVGYVPLSYLNPKTAKPYLPPVAKKKPEIKTAKKQEAGNAASAPPTETRLEDAAPVPQPTASDDGFIPVSEAPKSAGPVKKADLSLRCKINRIKIKDVFEEQKFCEKPPPKWIMI